MSRVLVIKVLLFFALSPLGQVGLWASEDARVIESVILTLDRFMVAGKEEDPKRGASLLDRYESSPNKAERDIRIFFEREQSIFANYVSIAEDIYGYEIKENGFRGPNISLEGRIETTAGLTSEFSARLVFRDQRWRILTLEID